MSWPTVIRNQNCAARVKHEQVPQSSFSGKSDDAIRTDLVRKLPIGHGFGWRTGKSDKQIRVPFEQLSGKLDIIRRRPTSQREQVARVRIEQDEWRRTDARIFI